MKKVLCIVVALLVMISLVACTAQSAATTTEAENTATAVAATEAVSEAAAATAAESAAEGDKVWKVGLPTYTMEHIYWVEWVNRMESNCKELGVEVVVADSSYDSAKQMQLIEDMISQGCNILTFCPVDQKGSSVAIEEAESKGTKVILTDLDVENEAGEKVASAFIGYDNMVAVGEEMAQWVADYATKNFNGVAKVAVLSYPPEVPCVEAEQGFTAKLEELLGADNVEFFSQNAQCTQEGGLNVTENILSANPDINVVWGANDECAIGGLAALESYGKTTKDAVVVSLYANSDVQEMIRADESMYKMAYFLHWNWMADAATDVIGKIVNGGSYEYETKVGFEMMDATTIDKILG